LEKIFKKNSESISVYIIGSYAKGIDRKDSDFDLVVVAENK